MGERAVSNFFKTCVLHVRIGRVSMVRFTHTNRI
jgi:hypothetical protein